MRSLRSHPLSRRAFVGAAAGLAAAAALPRPARAQSRVKIGYIHVWCYAGYAYQRELEGLLSEGALKDADALIWDLRDGWGGAVPEYLARRHELLRALEAAKT